MIHIVDYGLGNIGAFLTLYKRLGIEAQAATNATELLRAKRILLPGVGAFDHAMKLLEVSGMRDALDRKVKEDGVPVLGVCVGMQIMGDASDEGILPGLGWISGRIRDLDGQMGIERLPLPHLGWNDVDVAPNSPLFRGIEKPRFYFLHSFYFDNSDPADCAGVADYGNQFTCVINRDNVWGVQFHPEKSHSFGTALLKNFAEI